MTIEEIIGAQNDGCRFTVAGWSNGIAFYFDKVETRPDEDTVWTGQEVPTGNVLMIMVGDDMHHSVDPDDLTVIGELDYCHECGQVGCGHDGLVRD